MLPPFQSLLVLIVVGAVAATALAPRLERIEPARLAQGYLVGVAAFMGMRVLAYGAANVFGAQAMRPLGTGPRDLTNLLVGAFYGLAVAHIRRGRLSAFFREPNVLLAIRLATGVAFVLAGLVNVFLKDMGVDFFIQAGYTKTFRLFIMTAEVLGGVALLLPWRWLTLFAAAGLTIDMFGAVFTQVRVGQSVTQLAPPLVMLLRLAPLVALVLLGVKRRWTLIGVGAVACACVAVVGGRLLFHPAPATSEIGCRPPVAGPAAAARFRYADDYHPTRTATPDERCLDLKHEARSARSARDDKPGALF
jgi:DoxX-like protein